MFTGLSSGVSIRRLQSAGLCCAALLRPSFSPRPPWARLNLPGPWETASSSCGMTVRRNSSSIDITRRSLPMCLVSHSSVRVRAKTTFADANGNFKIANHDRNRCRGQSVTQVSHASHDEGLHSHAVAMKGYLLGCGDEAVSYTINFYVLRHLPDRIAFNLILGSDASEDFYGFRCEHFRLHVGLWRVHSHHSRHAPRKHLIGCVLLPQPVPPGLGYLSALREEMPLAKEMVTFHRSASLGSNRHMNLFWVGDQTTVWSTNDGIESVVTLMGQMGLSGYAHSHVIPTLAATPLPFHRRPSTASLGPLHGRPSCSDAGASWPLFPAPCSAHARAMTVGTGSQRAVLLQHVDLLILCV